MGRAHHIAEWRLGELAHAQPGQNAQKPRHPLDGRADLRAGLTGVRLAKPHREITTHRNRRSRGAGGVWAV